MKTQIQNKQLFVEVKNGNTFYYSYDTIVAYVLKDGTTKVAKNIWSVTTARHLNLIDKMIGYKTERVSPHDFDWKAINKIKSRGISKVF